MKVGEGPPEEGPTERDPRDAGEATPGSVTTGDPVAPRCGTHRSVRRVAPMGGYVLMLTMQRSKKKYTDREYGVRRISDVLALCWAMHCGTLNVHTRTGGGGWQGACLDVDEPGAGEGGGEQRGTTGLEEIVEGRGLGPVAILRRRCGGEKKGEERIGGETSINGLAGLWGTPPPR